MSRFIICNGVVWLSAFAAGCGQQDNLIEGSSAEVTLQGEQALNTGAPRSIDGTNVEKAPKPTPIADYREVDPYRKASDLAPVLAPCPADGIVAFSASASVFHVSEGPPTLILYGKTYTNGGGGWVNGGGTFSAPCTGLYLFSLSFVKDAYYNNGTNDDVSVGIWLNGIFYGNGWAGYPAMRDTGAYTVTLWLHQGDYVQTFAYSDEGNRRNLTEYNFTGLLVRM